MPEIKRHPNVPFPPSPYPSSSTNPLHLAAATSNAPTTQAKAPPRTPNPQTAITPPSTAKPPPPFPKLSPQQPPRRQRALREPARQVMLLRSRRRLGRRRVRLRARAARRIARAIWSLGLGVWWWDLRVWWLLFCNTEIRKPLVGSSELGWCYSRQMVGIIIISYKGGEERRLISGLAAFLAFWAGWALYSVYGNWDWLWGFLSNLSCLGFTG